MSDLDLDRLGELWRKELDAEAIEALRRKADAVKRRARWATIFDHILAALIVVTVLLIIFSDPRLGIVFVGGVAIVFLVLSQLRQRRYRRLELEGLAGGTEAMLDQLIARSEATLKRASSSLFLIGPATVLGVLFGLAADQDRAGGFFAQRDGDPLQILLVPLAVLVLAVILIHLYRTVRRSRRELERLTELRESYSAENAASGSE